MTATRPSPRAYQLTDAITEMVIRLGEAERMGAYAWERYLHSHDEADIAEWCRWDRAADRRFLAVQWLTWALRDVGVNR